MAVGLQRLPQPAVGLRARQLAHRVGSRPRHVHRPAWRRPRRRHAAVAVGLQRAAGAGVGVRRGHGRDLPRLLERAALAGRREPFGGRHERRGAPAREQVRGPGRRRRFRRLGDPDMGLQRAHQPAVGLWDVGGSGRGTAAGWCGRRAARGRAAHQLAAAVHPGQRRDAGRREGHQRRPLHAHQAVRRWRWRAPIARTRPAQTGARPSPTPAPLPHRPRAAQAATARGASSASSTPSR